MKQKIVLFDSNLQYVGTPLALLSITRLLDTNKYDIHIITKTAHPNYEEEILKHCKEAICFGVTCITGSPIKNALRVSELVKSKYPSLPVIWGGWQPTTLPDVTLENPNIDYICIGQGERTFADFINMLEKNDFDNIHKIRGLSYKKNGLVYHNSAREIEDLNNFPDFDLSLIDWEKYLEITDYGALVLRVVTSYGCPFRCGFCCEPLASERKWKALSAERIIKFLINLRSVVDFDGLVITDNNFFVHEQRVVDFCKGLINNGFNIKFGQVNGRTSNLVKFKETTWELLKEAGLYNILIGAESANDATLELINKDAKVEDTYLLSQICRKYGIKLVISTIIGLPMPSYFKDNQQEAFNNEFAELKKLYKDLFSLDSNNHILTFPYTPLPLSPLYEKAIELGFKPPKSLAEWANYDITDVHINWLSKESINKIQILNHTSMIISIDYKYLLKKLPNIIRIIALPVLKFAQFISNLRIKHDFYNFPLDRIVFSLGVTIFRRVNRIFKLVNIGG